MPAHAAAHNHLQRRQATSAEAPNGAGLGGTLTGATGGASLSSLLINTAVTGTSTPFIPPTSSSTSSSASATSTPADSSSSGNNSSGTSVGTVVGACIGAFIGFALLIIIANWFFRRPLRRTPPSRPYQNDRRNQEPPPMALSPLANALNAQADNERRRMQAAAKPYQHLDSGRDQHHLQQQYFPPPPPPEKRPSPAPSQQHAKLSSMFNKTPSLHSVEADRMSTFTQDLNADATFSKYHPFLAEELAKPPGASTPQSIPASRNTPFTTYSDGDNHKWESGELGHVNGSHSRNISEVSNPFSDSNEPGGRRNGSNPFFNAGAAGPNANRKRSNSTRSTRSNSNTNNPYINNPSARVPVPKLDEPSQSPPTITQTPSSPTLPPVAALKTHTKGDSVASATSDHALASLVAALNISPEEVQERLRIASMQSLKPLELQEKLRIASMQSLNPSIGSRASTITTSGIDDFPLPPNNTQ